MITSHDIKSWTAEAGFFASGIARARRLSEAERQFAQAIDDGRHAEMHFLERDVEKRFDPSLLLPNCKSVIVVAMSYLINDEPHSDRYRTARYTWIEDYHTLVSEKLETVACKMLQACPALKYRITVDSSCISEKNWAVEAGIGCYGKNGLIHNGFGSFFVLGTILTDYEFDEYDGRKESDCGDCRLCVESCPANALQHPFQVDARKCFSYHTVENKQPEDEVLKKAPLIFGCDVCQEVCPRNNKIRQMVSDNSKTSLFLHLQSEELETLSREDFKRCFGNTAIARRKYDRFMRAIQFKNKES